MRLFVSHTVQSDLIQHAIEGYPNEICGLLVGHGNHILQIIPTENGAPDKQSAFIIPVSALNVHIPKLRAEGLDLIGFYHSHPNSVPIPSETDIQELDNGLNLPHVLVGITPSYAEIKAWMIKNRRVDPIEWIIGDEFLSEPITPQSSPQYYAFILGIVVSLILFFIIALTLLPPAPELP